MKLQIRFAQVLSLALVLCLLAPAVRAQAPSTPAAPSDAPWIPNERVNDAIQGDQDDPAVAIGRYGTRYVAWTNDDRGVRLSYAPRGGDWGGNEAVSSSGQAIDIAADGAGNVHVLWENSGGLNLATRSVEGTWSGSQGIGPAALFAAVGADDAGNVHAAWLGPWVQARHRTPAGTWNAATTVWTGDASTRIWDVDLAVTAEGDAYLVWLTYEGETGEQVFGRTYAAYRPAGGTWGGATLIDEVSLPTDLGYGWLAADAAGNHAHAAWSMYALVLDGAPVQMPVNYARGSGSAWGAPVQVSGAPSPEEALRTNLAVGAGDQGAAHVCWTVSAYWEPIRCVKRGSAGGWGAVTVANDSVAVNRHGPHLAVRGNTVHAVWTDDRRGDYDVYYTTLPTPHLHASSPAFAPQSAFEPGHTLLLYSIGDATGSGDCCSQALDLYLVVNEDVGNPLLMENDGAGGTSRDGADFMADDCHHALWFQPTEATDYVLDLYALPAGESFDEAYWVDALRLEPRSDPDLAVLTDLRELHNEFNTTVPDSAQDDQDENCVADYYDAVERVRQYAEEHEGLVVDVRQDGYAADHVYTAAKTRPRMGIEIDSLVSDLPRSLQCLAIIGDDAVLPFYRLSDPSGKERTYLAKNTHNVPTVVDTQASYLMTDVPYGTWWTDQAGGPPAPALGVGRVFYGQPLDLVAALDAYEQAVVAGAQTSSAFVFNPANDSEIRWQTNTRALAISELQKHGYSTLTHSSADMGRQGRLGWLDAQAGHKWDGGWVSDALDRDNGNRLTLVNSHAWHLYNTTSRDRFDAGDFPTSSFPGAVFINGGCHSGYTTGYDASAAQWNYYTHALARAALARHLTYYAPTTYGWTTGGATMRHHNLVQQEFLLGLANESRATTGLNHKRAVYQYYKQYNLDKLEGADLAALYGLELYGLPTQPIQYGSTAVKVQRGISGARPARAADTPATVSLEVPDFRVTPDGQGHTLFEVPHGGRLTAQDGGPLVPLVVRSFYLPADTTDLAVTPVATDTALYPGSVTLPPQQVGSLTFGIQTVSSGDTAPYPATPYWTTVYTDGQRTELALSAVPLRYDPATGQVTLIHRLDFEVAYSTPATGVEVEDLVVNNGAPVAVGQATLPLTLTATAATTQPLTLNWLVEDSGATAVRSGSAPFTPTLGANVVTWNTDSLGWLPGPKVLHATLEDESGAVVAAGWHDFTVQGRSLVLDADRGVYGAADTQALLRAEVRDESGALVPDQAGAFTQELDGSSLALTWHEGGSYTTTLDLTTVGTGTHVLDVALGGEAAAQVAFGLDREPPTSTVSSPATAASAFTVTLAGGDDLSVDAFRVQYRVGPGGTWADWQTLAAGWDYARGDVADLALAFGPVSPVPLRSDTTYYFRAQAVDRAGNEEAEHAIADAVTTYTGPDYVAHIYLPLVTRNQ